MEFPTLSLGKIIVRPTTRLLLQTDLSLDLPKRPHTIQVQFRSGAQAIQDLL
jgi:hypothetical protein